MSTGGKIALAIGIAVAIGAGSLSFFGARLFGCMGVFSDVPTHELALRQIAACPAAAALLGTPVELDGVSGGTYETQGAFGASSWKIDVVGPKGDAEARYAAEMHGGRWSLTLLEVRAGGREIDALACPAGPPAAP